MSNHSFGDTDPVPCRYLNQTSGCQPSPRDARGLLDTINSAVWGVLIADPEGLVVYANAAFLQLFDYGSVGEVEGCPAADLFAIQEVSEGPHVQSPVDAAEQSTREFRICNRGGQTLDVKVASALVWDARGAQVGVMVSFAGGTLGKQAEREREQLIEGLWVALSKGKTLRDLLLC